MKMELLFQQENQMVHNSLGQVDLHLREGAGKGVWSGRKARKVCPGYGFVTILTPPKPLQKTARGGLQKRSGSEFRSLSRATWADLSFKLLFRQVWEPKKLPK